MTVPNLSTLNTRQLPAWLHTMLLFVICVLFALVQISWAGYQLGVGNQGIQMAFLQNLHNPEVFSTDPMVTQTLKKYPSFFFHICAHLLSFTDLSTLYLWLHLVATAGVFGAVALLAKVITRNHW